MIVWMLSEVLAFRCEVGELSSHEVQRISQASRTMHAARRTTYIALGTVFVQVQTAQKHQRAKASRPLVFSACRVQQQVPLVAAAGSSPSFHSFSCLVGGWLGSFAAFPLWKVRTLYTLSRGGLAVPGGGRSKRRSPMADRPGVEAVKPC